MAPGILSGSLVSDTTLPRNIPETQQTPSNRLTDQLFSLKNTTTIVTGAGRGLGICLASAIIEAGGHVACLDILAEPAEAEWTNLEKIAKAAQLSVSYHRCDITNDEGLREVFASVSEEAQKRNAPLQGTVACAGIQQKLPALEYPAGDFERILGVNVTGAFLTAKNAAKIMVANGTPGSIVLIASMSGNIANRVRTDLDHC
jgi:NAD(P)-dependent dehydrogenase (short-subunit alcohol dehydrogenase family)